MSTALDVQIKVLARDIDRTNTFVQWIAEYCSPDSLVLDIGAGNDRLGIDATLADHVACLVGVDPAKDILSNHAVHERHHMSLENFAIREERRFDIVFATMVLEHVSDPETFMAACRGLLKPGGMFFAVTPNQWHYFGLATKLSASLGIDEWLLDRLMGKQEKEEYHFPTKYRINSLRYIQRILKRHDFQAVELRCFDCPVSYNYVLPRPLRPFASFYTSAAYRLDLPHFMGTIMFRAEANPSLP